MIFRSGHASAQWDTWCYFYNETYYLYYLITEHSPGEGFGVAMSTDGVHWTDHGWAIRASDRMVHYLGTGSVWKAVDTPGRGGSSATIPSGGSTEPDSGRRTSCSRGRRI